MNVFLSHSTPDRKFVELLAAQLTAEGFTPWLCEASIEPGANWVQEMEKGLAGADLVLLVWSGAAARSYATELEWTSALAREISERRIRLGIVMVEDCALPELLRTRQYVDAHGDAGVAAVLAWVKGRRDSGRLAGGKAPVYLPDYKPENFVGRAEALVRLHAALVDRRGIFLLHGEPGSGKSVLASAFAWECQKDFDAVVFQTCGRRTVEEIAAELCERLSEQLGAGVLKLPPRDKWTAVKKWLSERQSLLVLDDIWPDAVQPGGMAARDLLPGPAVSVLLTSRRPALFQLVPSQSFRVASFTDDEAAAVFEKYLGAEDAARHRGPLLEFAARVERLPIAVVVGADLLRQQYGLLDEDARALTIESLVNDVHNVADLLDRAIQSQGPVERRFLQAASVCAPEGFWFPLAADISQLSPAEAAAARNNLVNASLLRVLDRERQRGQLHTLIRVRTRATADSSRMQSAHAAALERLFESWETRWKECRECLAEILPACEFLWNGGAIQRQSALSYRAYPLAWRTGELDSALRIARQQESFWPSGPETLAKIGLLPSYANQATVLRVWGRLEEAIELYKKQEALCLELDNKRELQGCYGNQALILIAWGHLEDALALMKKQEAICVDLGDKDILQRCLGNQATILNMWGRLDEALALLQRQEAICLESGDQDGLSTSYANQAVILTSRGRLADAMALLKKQEAISLQLGNKDGLQVSYANQAAVFRAWGRLDDALAMYRKQETICLELGNKDGLQASYANQALILTAWGQLDKALALHQKQEEICLALGNKYGLQASYGNQALILKAWGRLPKAMELLKKQEAICLELGNTDGLQTSYGNQALILALWGKPEEALALHKKEEAICLELGNNAALQRSYGNQALILKNRGELEDAMALLKLKEAICLETGNKAGLHHAYGNQAQVLTAWGKYDEALALHEKQEAICIELRDKAGLANCYWHWGVVARSRRDPETERRKLTAAYQLFTDLRMPREARAVYMELNPGAGAATS